MALDYRKFNHWDDFNRRIVQANEDYPELYPGGITGYEQYYVDLEGFWRYLYRPPYDSGRTLGYEILTLPDETTEQGEYPSTLEVYLKNYYRDADTHLGGNEGKNVTYGVEYKLFNSDGTTSTTVLDMTTTKHPANLEEGSEVTKVPLELYINRNLPILTTDKERGPLNYFTYHYTADDEDDYGHLKFNWNDNQTARNIIEETGETIMPVFTPGGNIIDDDGHEIDLKYQTVKGVQLDDSDNYYFDLSKNYFYIKNSNTNVGLYDVLSGDRVAKDWKFDPNRNRRGLLCDNYTLLIGYDDTHSLNELREQAEFYNGHINDEGGICPYPPINETTINDTIEYNSYKVYRDHNNTDEDHFYMFKFRKWTEEEPIGDNQVHEVTHTAYNVIEVSLDDPDGVREIVEEEQDGKIVKSIGDYIYLPSGFKRAFNDKPCAYHDGDWIELGKALTLKIKFTYYALTKVKPLITDFSNPFFVPTEAQIPGGLALYQITLDKQISFSEIPNLDEINLQLPYDFDNAYINYGEGPVVAGMVYKLIPYNFIEWFDYYLSEYRLEEKVEADDKNILHIGTAHFNWSQAINQYVVDFTPMQGLTRDDIRFGYYVNGDGSLKTSIQIIQRNGLNDLAWVNAETGEDPVLDRGTGHTYLQRIHEPIDYFKEIYQYNYSETFEENDPE